MTKRTIDFGEDVCYYKDISDISNIVYVKPCEEGKKCVQIGNNEYELHICIAYNGKYDNKNEKCVTKDNRDVYSKGSGIDCTGYTCVEDKCGATPTGACTENQGLNNENGNCVEDPQICQEFDTDRNLKKDFTPINSKECIRFELQTNDRKTYSYKIIYATSLASVDDGEFIKDGNLPYNYLYCKSGYALYFYGNKKLENPNPTAHTNHQMYLMCVTVEGRDYNGIIQYKVPNSETSAFYDPNELPINPSTNYQYQLKYNDEFLMTRLEMFNKYKENLDNEDESAKWLYFLENPEQYILYQNEPQIMEYLIKEKEGIYTYKVQHTASTESSNLLNMSFWIGLLSLILLF